MAGRTLCPCCGKLVSKQTKINHLKQRTGNPEIKACAVTYRQQVSSVAPRPPRVPSPGEVDDVELEYDGELLNEEGAGPVEEIVVDSGEFHNLISNTSKVLKI